MANARDLCKRWLQTFLWMGRGVAPPQGVLPTAQWFAEGGAGEFFEEPPADKTFQPPPRKTYQYDGSESHEEAIQYHPSSHFLAHIENGRVAERTGSAITPDNHLLEELSPCWSGEPSRHPLLACGKLPPVKRVAGKVAVLSSYGGENYYHWFTEALPRLRLIQQQGLDFQWCYAPNQFPFHRESLRLLGVSDEQILPVGRFAHIQADGILAASIPSRQHHLPAPFREFLRERFLGNCLENETPSAKTPTRIYISRRQAKRRKIVNESELREVLRSRGFQTVYLEQLPLVEQIRLFAGAEAIVAAHGAGLTNLLFARPETAVLEIGTPDRLLHCFYNLAWQGKQRYAHLLGRAVRRRPRGGDSDIEVGLEGLQKTLAELDL